MTSEILNRTGRSEISVFQLLHWGRSEISEFQL